MEVSEWMGEKERKKEGGKEAGSRVDPLAD